MVDLVNVNYMYVCVSVRCGEVIRGFRGGSVVNNLPANAGDEMRHGFNP